MIIIGLSKKSKMKKIIKKILGEKLSKKLRGFYTKTRFSEAKLIETFFFNKNIVGTMIDAGVHFGESFINFAKNNWTIFGIEPNPESIAKIPKSNNFTLYQNAVSDIDGQDVVLYTSTESTGITSLVPFHSDHKPFVNVKTISLRTIIQKENLKKIDYLKIDIEGYDLFALKGFPFEILKPSIIMCEFEDKKTQILNYTYKDLADYLSKQDYTVYVSEWDPITKYGIQHKWRHISLFTGSINNEDAWGNFIAVSNEYKTSFDTYLKGYIKSNSF